jgi:protein-disulfide isomerase
MPKLEAEYIKTGKLRYVLMDFPLESIHPDAAKAAEAAHCAGEQGLYWELHDRLFANHRSLPATSLPAHAEAVGAARHKFQECLDSGRQGARVRRGLAEGRKAGVTATPTFVLALAEADGSTVRAVHVLRGAQPFATFKAAIDGILSSLK